MAEDQPEFETLPAHVSKDGVLTACFQLTPDEITAMLKNGGRIYYQQHVGHKGIMNPMNLSVTNQMVIDPEPVVRPEDEFRVEKNPDGEYILIYCDTTVYTAKLKGAQEGVQECKNVMRDLINKSNES